VRVVEALAAGEDDKASLRPVGERFLLDQLAFERRKEGFTLCALEFPPSLRPITPLEFAGLGRLEESPTRENFLFLKRIFEREGFTKQDPS